MDEIFEEIKNFNEKYFPNWDKVQDVYYSNAIAGECGELCNKVKKMIGGGTSNIIILNDELYEECADILIYISLLLMKHKIDGSDFKEIILEKILENKNRMDNKKTLL